MAAWDKTCGPCIAAIADFLSFFTRRACATAYNDQSNSLCFFRILITKK